MSEADKKELVAILSERTDIDENTINKVLDELPHSIAGWLLGYRSKASK
jgi:hypothetical protein